MREELLKNTTESLAEAVELRDNTAMARAMVGKRLHTVTVCLGSYRCLFPTSDGQAYDSGLRSCPFCKVYPEKATAAEVKEWARIYVGGN